MATNDNASVCMGTELESTELIQRNLSSSSATPLPLRLIITTETTGYTCQNIYGAHLSNRGIVVPVYKLEVVKDNKVIANYNVTRDSWYNRGLIQRNLIRSNKHELSNRCFEPADANVNLYATVPTAYPLKGLDAYALRQKGSERIKAVSHTNKMNTFVDGTPIDDARDDLSIASGVMIHIGGWYSKGSGNALAGSYGCFGVIPQAQIRKTKKEAEDDREKRNYQKFEPANKAYKAAINYIINNTPKGTTPQVLIKKRNNVEQLREIDD